MTKGPIAVDAEVTDRVIADRGPIPGPRGWEKWRLLGELRERPFDRLLQLALEYGDIVMLDYTTERVVLISNPEYIEHVLHHRHQTYDKQTARWKSVRQIWGYGLLTADGDLWRRQRQRMQPAFHQEALKGFADMVVEEAGRVAATWSLAAQRGESRDVYQDMLGCAICAITRAAFGSDIAGKTDLIIRALDDVNQYVNPIITEDDVVLGVAAAEFRLDLTFEVVVFVLGFPIAERDAERVKQRAIGVDAVALLGDDAVL